jgi:hypothetical protein
MNDNELDALIRQTHPVPELPASFQREVWARVADAEDRSWTRLWEVFLAFLARPVPAAATVALMLGAGIGLGSLTAPEAPTTPQRTTYFASINPLSQAHAGMHE